MGNTVTPAVMVNQPRSTVFISMRLETMRHATNSTDSNIYTMVSGAREGRVVFDM